MEREQRMSNILSLTRGYGFFFRDCAKFAISPYTDTFSTIANDSQNDKDEYLKNIRTATVMCGIFTFVVPVLPVVTVLASTFAAIAALLAVCSMLLTYPLAIATDICGAPDLACYEESPFQPIFR